MHTFGKRAFYSHALVQHQAYRSSFLLKTSSHANDGDILHFISQQSVWILEVCHIRLKKYAPKGPRAIRKFILPCKLQITARSTHLPVSKLSVYLRGIQLAGKSAHSCR
eukprot:scaffold188289_cov20-Tisochrysis_lutea.AAC.1